MLSPKIIAEAARLLLAQELSQRQIAARLGISRGTVLAIAQRRRRNVSRRLAKRRFRKMTRREASFAAIRAKKLPVRCIACGYWVILPCRICASRKQRDEMIQAAG